MARELNDDVIAFNLEGLVNADSLNVEEFTLKNPFC